MKFNQRAGFKKWLGFAIATIMLIVAIIMLNVFINNLKRQEHQKVKYFAVIQKLLVTSDESTPKEALDFYLEYLQKMEIPLVVIDEKGGLVASKNIGEDIIKDKQKLREKINDLQDEYPPIFVKLESGNQKIYYSDSLKLVQLQYYPLAFLVFVFLFGLFSFWYYQTIKYSEQSLLWAGMAKETAHQLGTPLSSLLGWTELLKMEKLEYVQVEEIEKDLGRLSIVANRFYKIGSEPQLSYLDIVQLTEEVVNYIQKRVSSKIDFQFSYEEKNMRAKVSPDLYQWVIENLIKNGIDAMPGKGLIKIHIFWISTKLVISITDTGSGIKKSDLADIFSAGYSTKTRGWGLGLSLAKRIINDFHHGRIYVYQTIIGKGTEFRIELPK